ncbi:hypothetical protein CN394_05465 [Bacillus anthracis]|nr:hypothetical protein CN394_05465 [Bacillus anthracis]PEZ70536.1 hypothetical protein CN410_24380 [Bacillus anthracis]
MIIVLFSFFILILNINHLIFKLKCNRFSILEWNYHFIILILLVIVTVKSLLYVKSFEYEKVVMEFF